MEVVLNVLLDIFRKNMDNRGINNKLDVWLAFLSMDSPEVITELAGKYPEFRAMYEHVYNICQNVEEALGMYSEELKILDQNTVRYMIKQMQKKIDSQKEQLEQLDKEIEQRNKEIEWRNKEIEWQNKEIERRNKEIEQRNKEIERRNKEIEQRSKEIEQRNKEIEQRSKEIEQRNKQLEQQDK